MQTKSLPKFQGKPLVEVPKAIPQVDFLRGDLGREVDQEVRSRHPNLPNISNINYQNEVIQGSNPFYVVAVNEVLRQEGLRTATQANLEKTLKLGVLDLKGHYEDSSLVLRSEADSYQPNDHLSRSLHKQVKARNAKIEYPVIIPLNGLELQADQDSSYGLSFRLREDAEVIYAQILVKDGSFRSEDINEETGLPRKLESDGNRHLYTRQDGLSGLFLSRNLDLYSYRYLLDVSDSDGRVVVVSDAVAPKNFDYQKAQTEITREYETQLNELNQRKEKALQILKGKQ
ncbi:hypothetical protein J4455_02660 [Candidatus Woesearchaeota archaeon]|nr:hypothetical protein [Candidatus Woesearchaeota archaeon]